MECLDGLIGIRGKCSTDSPDSLLYINDLPGLSIKDVDASLNSESASAVELIEQKIQEAGELVITRLQTLLLPKFKGDSLISNGVVGFVKDNQETIETATGYLVGKHIEISEGAYKELFISKVGIHAVATGNVSVVVWDLVQNKLLDTMVVTCVAGEVSYLDVFKTYRGQGQRISLFIGYAYTASYKTTLSLNNCTSCTGQVYSNPHITFANRKILSSDTKIKENLTSGEDGLIIQYSVNCTFTPFVCSIKHLMAPAIRWKAGELLAMEMVYSKRNNSYITIYAEDNAELLKAYSVSFETEINNIFQNMRLPNNECYYCNKKVKLETRI